MNKQIFSKPNLEEEEDVETLHTHKKQKKNKKTKKQNNFEGEGLVFYSFQPHPQVGLFYLEVLGLF